MNLIELETAISHDLGNIELRPMSKDDSEETRVARNKKLVKRAIDRASSDISRAYPKLIKKELKVKTKYNQKILAKAGVTKLTVQLPHPNIKPGSEILSLDEVVQDKSIYSLDYFNGVITIDPIISEVNYDLKYETLSVSFQLSDLATDTASISSIKSVEYPAGSIPQEYVDIELLESYFVVKSRKTAPRTPQQSIPDDELLWVLAEALQDSPTDTTSGSWPRILDEVVIKGSMYYLLYAKALSILQQAESVSMDSTLPIEDMEFSDVVPHTVSLTDVSFNPTNIQIPTPVTVDLVDMPTLINPKDLLVKPNVNDTNSLQARIEALLGSTDTELTKAQAQLVALDYTKAEKALDGVGTADASDLILKAVASITEANHGVKAIIEKVATSDLDNAATGAASFWAQQKRWLESSGGHSDANAESHLDAGTDLINKINLGDRAAMSRADFARAAITASRQYLDNRLASIQQAQTRIAQAQAKLAESQSYIEGARTRNNQASLYLQMNQYRLENASGAIGIAQTKLTAFSAMVEVIQTVIAYNNQLFQNTLQSNSLLVRIGEINVRNNEVAAQIQGLVIRSDENRVSQNHAIARQDESKARILEAAVNQEAIKIRGRRGQGSVC